MNYLKNYNMFENNNESLCKSISYEEYNKLIDDKGLDIISQSESITISDFFRKIGAINIHQSKNTIWGNSHDIRIESTKYNDDWYCFRYEHIREHMKIQPHFYLLDTLEGLEELYNNIK